VAHHVDLICFYRVNVIDAYSSSDAAYIKRTRIEAKTAHRKKKKTGKKIQGIAFDVVKEPVREKVQ